MFLYGLILGIPGYHAAAQANIRYETIGVQQGLSHQSVNCIFQDHQGFIWLGTGFGLNRFDGISCKTYYHKKNDTNSLVHNLVLGIAEDAQHHVWISTQEGISRLDPFTQTFTNYSINQKGKQFYDKTFCHIFITKENRIWVGHSGGLSLFDSAAGRFNDIPLQLQPPGKINNRFVTSFLQDAKNRLWVSTSYGVRLIDQKTLQVTSYHFNDTTPEIKYLNACRQITADRKGRIVAGTWGGGIIYFDEPANCFRQRKIAAPWHIVHGIVPIVENNTDYLLLGTEGGFVKLPTDELLQQPAVVESYFPEKPEPAALHQQSSSMVIQDRSLNIWLASGNGVSKIDPLNQQFRTLATGVAKPVHIILPAFNNRQFWTSTGEHHYLFDRQREQFTQVSIFNKGRKVGIRTMAKGKHHYWLTTAEGLLQCDTAMKVQRHYGPDAFPVNRLFSVCEDHTGTLWMGTSLRGIVTLDPLTGTMNRLLHDASQPYDITNDLVWTIEEDSRHNVWIGTTAGLYQYIRQQNKFVLYRINDRMNALVDNIQCITETKDGKIWIGSKEGIRCFDYASGVCTAVSPETELLNDEISGIVEDRHGILWLTTRNGLLRYNPRSGKTTAYNSAHGLPVSDLTYGFYGDAEDNIYIGTTAGITVFNAAALTTNMFSPPPVITAISVGQQPAPLLYSRPVQVPYDQSISVDFVALNYSNAANNQYAYKLEGADKEWNLLGSNRTVRFSNLAPGHYTLQLKAANNESIWNEHTTHFSFVVIPPFWRTWWFTTLLVAIVAAGVYALYRYRVNHLIGLEKLRTRIATDLHDDIGATLSSISFYSEAIRQRAKDKLPEVEHILEKMGETSRSMVGSMSDIVWAINPDNDHFDKLVRRMHSYAAELCSIKNITLQFHSNEMERNIQLSLEQRKNMYLIFKEAINNALKYAACHTLRLHLHTTGGNIQMEIQDDGKGFNTDGEFKGNGLKNMQLRAREIHAHVNITSAPGKGTSIAFELKI
jgi:ligand-binding sensor domain-containing protein/two-component sensor histidine kinase